MLTEDYYSSQNSNLPWRWAGIFRKKKKNILTFFPLAPESIKYSKFNSKSDVWSFGVTLYELFTKGAVPYYEFHTAKEIYEAIEKGYVLEVPLSAPKFVNEILSKCLSVNPDKRLPFKEIVQLFP